MFESLVHAFKAGGWGMWPIAATAVTIVAVTVDRIIYLFFTISNQKESVLRELYKYILRGDLGGALRFLDSQKAGPIVKVIKAGLLKVHRSDFEVQAALDQASLQEMPKIEARTGYLAVLSNAAVLFGLLGTISGLITCFGAVANVDPSQKATILAAGIAEAMNCTAFGLGTSIPALLLFAWLQARSQHLIDDINESVVTVMNLVVGNRDQFDLTVLQNAEGERAAGGRR
ncbi:MotA/TolQ/ExbB proton channel family protein [Myxococcota bacterium]|nr:MotA/TolQ/ExbB proton channel family protein [Myxococcota bacterium]